MEGRGLANDDRSSSHEVVERPVITCYYALVVEFLDFHISYDRSEELLEEYR